MKKIFSICLFALATVTLQAQTTYMHVKLKADSKAQFVKGEDGIFQIAAADVDSIYFEKHWSGGIIPVDMGLASGLKWANVNFGATKANEIGTYSAWGKNGDGFVNMTDIAGSDYDPVAAAWGNPWRMPKRSELEELVAGCTSEWVNRNDSLGLLLTAKNGGATIFLPATNYQNSDGEDEGQKNRGYYWSSTQRDEENAWAYYFASNSTHWYDYGKEFMLAIRPVYDEAPPVEISVTKPILVSYTFGSATLKVAYTASDETASVQYGVEYTKLGEENWVPVLASSDGQVTLRNLDAEAAYAYRGFAQFGGRVNRNPESGTIPSFTTNAAPSPKDVKVVSKTAVSAGLSLSLSETDPLSTVDYGVEYAKQGEEDTWTDWTAVAADASGRVSLEELDAETTYRYRGYATYKEVTKYDKTEEYETFTTLKPSKYVMPEFVDLGLSSGTLWATFNIGAEQILDKGGYFGWGDPTGDLTDTNSGVYGTGIIPPASLDTIPEADIVTVNFGEGYHIPTKEQFEELRSCQMELIGDYQGSGIAGWLVHGIGSKSNNTVFFPCGGYRERVDAEGKEVISSTAATFYWTSQLDDGTIVGTYGQAVFAKLESSGVNCYNNYKARGMNIRAVYESKGSTPDPGPEIIDDPDDNPATQIVKQLSDGSIVPKDGVDLGLPSGTKWASWNLGAKNKENDYGQYYQWGETESDTEFTNDTYTAACKGFAYPNSNYFASYRLKPEYDAATVLWGDEWQMPTEDDFNELMENVNMEWDNGLKLTSKINKKTLYFPAAGYKSGTYIRDAGTMNYWTSSVWTSGTSSDKKNYAKCLYYASTTDGTPSTFNYRYCGLLIRPVKK